MNRIPVQVRQALDLVRWLEDIVVDEAALIPTDPEHWRDIIDLETRRPSAQYPLARQWEKGQALWDTIDRTVKSQRRRQVRYNHAW